MPVVLDDELRERVTALERSGKRLAAVKLVRQETQCSLSEALSAVKELAGEEVSQHDEADDGETLDEVAALLVAGRRIDAIRLLRARRNLSLREAKQGVDALAAGLGIEPKGGCAAVALLLGASPIAAYLISRL